MAQADYFLKIDGIDGESTDSKHKGEIDVLSFSWGVSQSGALAGGAGAGAGKAQFQDFHFSSSTSKASPHLFLACASGQHIKKAELFCRKAGAGAANAGDFMKLTFSDVLISGFSQSGNGDTPMESISLNFTKIEFEFKPQNADGTLGAAVRAGWDVKANKKV